MTSPPGLAGSTIQLLETAVPDLETKPRTKERNDAICASCPHPLRDHDRIAVRYCTATARATTPDARGCVCTTKETR